MGVSLSSQCRPACCNANAEVPKTGQVLERSCQFSEEITTLPQSLEANQLPQSLEANHARQYYETLKESEKRKLLKLESSDSVPSFDDLERALQLVKEATFKSAVEGLSTASNQKEAEKMRKAIKKKAQQGMFSWLNWSPQPNTELHASLHRNFPDAIPGIALHHRFVKICTEQYGCTGDNTLFGSSVCPDEINNLKGNLINLMVEYWGEVFPMGGISGAPFVGKTGFKAFSSHVPDDGNIIIVFAPHVSLSPDGVVGKYLRDGQASLSSACGAVIGGYNACLQSDVTNEAFDEADMQMGWIKSQLAPHAKDIEGKENPMAALAHQAYEIVNKVMQQVVNTNFGSGRLILLGGIQINMPPPCAEYFLPLSFEVRQAGKESEDVLKLLRLPSDADPYAGATGGA